MYLAFLCRGTGYIKLFPFLPLSNFADIHFIRTAENTVFHFGRRSLRLVRGFSKVVGAQPLLHVGRQVSLQSLHLLLVGEAGERTRLLRFGRHLAHGRPLVASLLGLLRREVEVPALGVLARDLVQLLSHEAQVLGVVDGAEQALPQLGAGPSPRQARQASWPRGGPDSVVQDTW